MLEKDNTVMRCCYPLITSLLFLPLLVVAQTTAGDSILKEASLRNVIDYAIMHQPTVTQAQIDEKITENSIKNKLADWYPQVNFNYNIQHNFQVPTTIFNGSPVRAGVNNTALFQFTASQNIFNRDVLLASRSKDDVRIQARQNTASHKIELAAAVSKAFYDVLATEQQIKVADENINRLDKSMDNAFQQYQQGIVDKTDYKRAAISLNNTKAQKQSYMALQKAKIEYLKALMGYPVAGTLQLMYDSLQMEREISLDTLQSPDPSHRIEYQLLQTQQKLLQVNLQYNKWAYLPNLSANAAYNANYLNDKFSKLYADNYPNSYFGLTLSLPLFQGGKRKYNIDNAQWQLKQADLSMVNLRSTVNAEFADAMANYKSSFASYVASKENVNLAKEVYDIIQLQYQSGVKSYIEVITAEAELRTSQINYYDALYQVLASKIDVEKSLGQIIY